MIISASRRTDIPAYYADWFFRRIQEGYALVRNPMNPRQLSRIRLTPDVVDGIVFWTKNPLPMLPRLDALREYMYYFQFTLNAYGTDVETNLPGKNHTLIPAFQALSERIGPERVIWRYDPIFLSATYSAAYHLRYFEQLAKRLCRYTKQCTISFLDFYRSTEKNMAGLSLQPFPPEEQAALAKELAAIAVSYGLQVDTCAEKLELSQYGIGHACCVDATLFERLLGCPLAVKTDKNQRHACGCAESIDIGAYDTCRSGCRYCYASRSEKLRRANEGRHNPASPLLIGEVDSEDKITERAVRSYRTSQLQL